MVEVVVVLRMVVVEEVVGMVVEVSPLGVAAGTACPTPHSVGLLVPPLSPVPPSGPQRAGSGHPQPRGPAPR